MRGKRFSRRGFLALLTSVVGFVVGCVRPSSDGGGDADGTETSAARSYAVPQRSIQSMIDAAPSGTIVEVPAGIYREQVTINKPLTLLAEPGAEIRGSDVWTGWAKQSGYWIKSGLPDLGSYDAPALPGSDGRCNWPEQVFWDGQPLRQVRQHPSQGQFAVTSKRAVVLSDDPAGHLVEVTTRKRWIVGTAPDATIKGFRMRHAASPPQRGAIECSGFDRWTISDNVLSDASGAVIYFEKSRQHQLLRNEIFNGGQEGLALYRVSDSLILSNHIHDNNTEEFDPDWEAAGMKAAECANLSVQRNTFDHNLGAGLWFDLDSTGARVLGNRLHHNSDTGIAYEISQSGLFQGNACWENGWREPSGPGSAGIFINSSKTTQILENVLGWNPKGIVVMSQQRSDGLPSTGIIVARNVIASSDDFVPGSRFGLCWFQDYDGMLYRDGSGNQGDENRYWYLAPEDHVARFHWTANLSHLAEFNQTPGEHDGRYLSTDEKDELLAQAEVPLSQEQH